MHIFGNLLIFILLVVVIYKAGSVYLNWYDKRRFQKKLRDEIKRLNEKE
jgi:hypothetical protein